MVQTSKRGLIKIGLLTLAVLTIMGIAIWAAWRPLAVMVAPFAAAQARFDFTIKQVIQTGDIALMHTKWNVSGPQTMTAYAIEAARRQPDGTWRWLIGDPFTIGRT